MEAAIAKKLAQKAWDDDDIPRNIHVYLSWWWLDDRDIPSQNELFRLIQKRIVGLIGSYELAVAAAKKDPGVIAKVDHCLQMMRRMTITEYVSWFHTRSSSGHFQGKAAHEWFTESGHVQLAESLVHKPTEEPSRVNQADLPLSLPDTFGEVVADYPVELALSVQRAFAKMSAPDDWLRNALKDHHPSQHGVPPQARRELLQLYSSLVEEAERLLKVLTEASERDDSMGCSDFSTAALLSFETLFRRGPAFFGEWYFSAQPEFRDVPPNAWFVRGDSYLLAALFQSFIPCLAVTGKQWDFMGDSGCLPVLGELDGLTKQKANGSAEKKRPAEQDESQ